MYIHDFFQNFLKTFLVCFHGAFTNSVIAPDMRPAYGGVGLIVMNRAAEGYTQGRRACYGGLWRSPYLDFLTSTPGL